MRILLLIIAVAVLASFKEPESCEHVSVSDDMSHLVIFPICGDSSLYIVRVFNSNYLSETVYKNKKKFSATSSDLSPTGKDELHTKNIHCNEFFYQDNVLKEVRSYNKPDYLIVEKYFIIDTNLLFQLNYYPNGFIQNYTVIKGDCQRWQGVELDPMNTYIWRGRYDGIYRQDTTTIIDTATHKSTIGISRRCSEKVGTWTKTDFSGKILETIKYSDNAENKMRNK